MPQFNNMGLDMYLEKKTYVGNKYRKPEQQIKVVEPENQEDTPININQEKISSITEETGYWRKANAIHNWFVKNVQKGEDDCKRYEVDYDQMKQLLELCNKVIKASKLIKGKICSSYSFDKDGKKIPTMIDGKNIEDHSVAEKLLPTQSGFFFGCTDYDECYLGDIKNTKKILTEALKSKSGEFYYQSSW